MRAHLLHGAAYRSLALVDAVALAPWGSEFFRLVAQNPSVFARIPPPLHEALVRAYIAGAAYRPLSAAAHDMLTDPWLGEIGQPAFYRQIAQADQRYTDEIEALYPNIMIPTLVVWGTEDAWIPVDRAHRLADPDPRCRTEAHQRGRSPHPPRRARRPHRRPPALAPRPRLEWDTCGV